MDFLLHSPNRLAVVPGTEAEKIVRPCSENPVDERGLRQHSHTGTGGRDAGTRGSEVPGTGAACYRASRQIIGRLYRELGQNYPAKGS